MIETDIEPLKGIANQLRIHSIEATTAAGSGHPTSCCSAADIVATLAALLDGDSLSFTRLQDMLDLTPGNLITHLRKLENAGYLTSETTGNGRASRTSITLTRQGRAALNTYTQALRDLLGGL